MARSLSRRLAALAAVLVAAVTASFVSPAAPSAAAEADHDADVINLSLSGSQDSPTLDAAIVYATSRNVTVVIAAGNGGSSNAGQDGYPAASAPSAIRVAGTDQNGALYSWSNHGSWADIAAPGSTSALLANGTVADNLQGTSMSAPYVSGTVGLMLSTNSRLSPADVKRILLANGSPVAGLDVASGKRLDAYRALVGAGYKASPAPATVGTAAAPAPRRPRSASG